VRQDGLRRAVAQIVHDPVQAPLVREAFEVFGAGQRSIRQLRDLMADQGLRTTLGAIPAVSQMHRLLRNKLYMGVVSWHGEEHQGDYETIVDPELFETVQAVIRKHQGGVVRERRHHHYLRGKLICAKCDSRWTDMQVNRQHDGLATSCLQKRPPSAASPSSRPSGSAFSGSTSPAAWR
jgi:Recombinase